MAAGKQQLLQPARQANLGPLFSTSLTLLAATAAQL